MESNVKLGVTTVVALLSATVGVGVTWGAYSTRLKAEEAALEENRRTVQQQQQTLTDIQAQYRIIIYRLDRIEGIARSKTP